MKYDSSDITPIRFPSPQKLVERGYKYTWKVEFISTHSERQYNIDYAEWDYEIELIWKSGTELLVEIYSTKKMETDHSYKFQMKLFKYLDMEIGQIRTVEGIEKNKWPFFRF